MRDSELRRVAKANGVATSYRMVGGRWHQVEAATLQAVLEAMGVDPSARPAAGAGGGPPPVLVTRQGRDNAPAAPAGSAVVLESGEELPAPERLPGDLPLGYHRLLDAGGDRPLVVAPDGCHLPDWLAEGGRARGWAAQLPSLRSRRSWGIGDLGDLGRLAAGPDRSGFVLLSPLHAVPPTSDSPYYPSSRLFRDPIYVEVEAVPETGRLDPAARERFRRLAEAGRGLTAGGLVDRPAVWRCKDQALRICWEALGRHPERVAALQRWRAATPEVDEFAVFSAIKASDPGDWRAWPPGLRRLGSTELAAWAAAHGDEVGYHAYLQWLLDEQLAAAAGQAGGERRLGIVNDLAVGFDPGGFDALWARDQLAEGVSVGAPPDPLGPQGQDWGLPAFVPRKLAERGYEPFARTLRTGMAHAGGLRLDHVMGLFRLFWIPEGASPTEGTYVRYPADDLFGVLALESRRAGALVIGEDLGTVEAGVRQRMRDERVLSYRLLWFERERGGARRKAARYPRLALAAVTTHDLPTAAGLLTGDDLRHTADIGVVPPDGVEALAERQQRERRELYRLLEDEGVLARGERSVEAVVAAMYAFLARTPAVLVAVTLEDAVLTRDRPNVPGTTTERPNWRIPLPVPLEDLWELPSVRRVLAAVETMTAAQPEPAEGRRSG
jgi:4-alpha-glucanotransferase